MTVVMLQECRFIDVDMGINRAAVSYDDPFRDPTAKGIRVCATQAARSPQQLRADRLGASLSLRELAGRAGVSKATVWKWEHGLTVPSPWVLHRWADICSRPNEEVA